MLLQPIIENVFTHAFIDFNQNCILQIEFYETENHLCIKIEDNGIGFKNSEINENELHFGISINSIQARLQTMFGKNQVFEITSKNGIGTKIKIEIPKITNE